MVQKVGQATGSGVSVWPGCPSRLRGATDSLMAQGRFDQRLDVSPAASINLTLLAFKATSIGLSHIISKHAVRCNHQCLSKHFPLEFHRNCQPCAGNFCPAGENLKAFAEGVCVHAWGDPSHPTRVLRMLVDHLENLGTEVRGSLDNHR
jgi:hypothetical protein